MLRTPEEIDDWIQSVSFSNELLHKSQQDAAGMILQRVDPTLAGYAWLRMLAEHPHRLT